MRLFTKPAGWMLAPVMLLMLMWTPLLHAQDDHIAQMEVLLVQTGHVKNDAEDVRVLKEAIKLFNDTYMLGLLQYSDKDQAYVIGTQRAPRPIVAEADWMKLKDEILRQLSSSEFRFVKGQPSLEYFRF